MALLWIDISENSHCAMTPRDVFHAEFEEYLYYTTYGVHGKVHTCNSVNSVLSWISMYENYSTPFREGTAVEF